VSESIRRVAIVFSGGPAPAANAVISAAVTSFLDAGHEVVGLFHGYSALQDYDADARPLIADEDYRVLGEADMRGMRNRRGIVLGTARANPGKGIKSAEDLRDPDKTERLRRVYQGLCDLGCDALISIGGDDTLKTANFLARYQDTLPAGCRRVRVVHLPKTIDNDYRGIDFTFGFFTAVDFMAREVLNLREDAIATRSYFIVETMGRKAGWLAYGVGMAGEANLVLAVEDIVGDLAVDGTDDDPKLDMDKLANRIVDLMLVREARDNKRYGIVVLAEGLAELLPESFLAGVGRDDHGHISLGKLDLGRMVSEAVTARYAERTGRETKVKSVQLGYESRCSPPHAFDVMLGSQLGVGAYRALVEEGLDAHMVSVSGQLDLQYVPFDELVNPHTMVTEVRLIERGSDYHTLARFLETKLDRQPTFPKG
jgi:6-phosphofructokinase